MITLCPTTWEKAAKMKNFSGWVRQKIKEEMEKTSIKRPDYWAYCQKCDMSAYGPDEFMLKYKFCPKCHDAMEYQGLVE